MWRPPKTDWVQGDPFEIIDYNRIRGNLDHLGRMAEAIWVPIESVDLGAEKAHSDIYYADEFNTFGDAVDVLAEQTQTGVGNKVTYQDNGPFIDSTDLNRIESATLVLKDRVMVFACVLDTLPVRLTPGRRIGGLFG